MSSELELLKHTDIFHEVPDTQLAKLAAGARRRPFEPGEVIFEMGDPGTSAMLVEFGEVKLTIESPTKQEITLAHRVEGDLFGEMALFDGEPRSAAAIATTNTQCLVIQRSDFLSVLDADPTMARAVMSSLARTIRRMNEMLTQTGLHPHQRLVKELRSLAQTHGHIIDEPERLLQHLPEGSIRIDRPVTDADLASLTQLFAVQVGPLLANLQYRDVIRRDGAQMIIVRPGELEKMLAPA